MSKETIRFYEISQIIFRFSNAKYLNFKNYYLHFFFLKFQILCTHTQINDCFTRCVIAIFDFTIFDMQFSNDQVFELNNPTSLQVN